MQSGPVRANILLRRIRELELDTVSKFPQNLIYCANDINLILGEHGDFDPANTNDDSSDQDSSSIVDIEAFNAKVLVRLEHLKNMFFLERLLTNKRGRSLELLSISADMVALTLVFWTHKNRLSSVHGNFEWLVMDAAPAGGVLCMELMNPTPMALAEAGVETKMDSKLSRSSIIQQLSLLVGFLGWVAPSAPNWDLCQTVKGVIQRVLDYTLNNPAGPPIQGQPMNLAGAGLEIEANDIFFNFDLMDTFDWLRPDGGFDGMQTS